MRKASLWLTLGFIVTAGSTVLGACGSDDDEDKNSGSGGTGGIPENTGSQCKVPEDCFKELKAGPDGATVQGTVTCLDPANGGYCTHTCNDDADCCAIDGECKTGLKQVCSPFESTGGKMCFLSCENGDVVPPDGGSSTDPEEFCQREVATDFSCRSSGGGNQNRKICYPADCGYGEGCIEDTDCASGLVCVLDGIQGGYCGKVDCATNADCDPNTTNPSAVCVKRGDTGSYCLRTCTGDTDCSFCRPRDYPATCSDQVTFVEAVTTGRVCVPPPK